MVPLGAGSRAPCQRTTAVLNGTPLARVLLDRGWRDYEVALPARLLRPEGNELRSRFAHAERPAGIGLSREDRRPLAVAFTRLAVLSGAAAP